MVIKVLAVENLGPSFTLNNNTKKVDIKVDGSTIKLNSDGSISINDDHMAFIEAVQYAQTITELSTRIDDAGNKMLYFIDEKGQEHQINLSSFLTNVHLENAQLEGQFLVLSNSNGETVNIDLGQFATDDEVVELINDRLNTIVFDAFGRQLFKVAAL